MGIFEKAIIEQDSIIDYIPQRPPMVMIHSFYGIHENVSYSELKVEEDNIFIESGVLSECGIIEHIAQSAAARVGYLCREEDREVPTGFIGSVNNFTAFSYPSIGSKIQTEITVEQEIMNVTLISATVTHGEHLIAKCKMKIYLQNN